MISLTLYVDNDNLITLSKLTKVSDGTLINNSSGLSVTLKDLAGNNVVGQPWPTAMNYVTGSDGTYVAELSSTLQLTKNLIYKAHVDYVDGADVAHWEVKAKARERVIQG